jgi:hypothetical protein
MCDDAAGNCAIHFSAHFLVGFMSLIVTIIWSFRIIDIDLFFRALIENVVSRTRVTKMRLSKLLVDQIK